MVACRRRWLGFRRGVPPRAVPPLPARDLRRGHRAGPRHRAAARGAREQPGQPRLPLLRPARLRQDHQRADPGPGAELRAGAGRRPVRRVRQSCRDLARGGPGLDRRDRDRRGLPRRRRRRPRPAREGVLRAGAQPLQGLHHRRGPHGHARRASTPCSSWSRSRRRTCGSSSPPPSPRRCIADHPLAHPPLPVPADPAAAARRPTSPSCASRRACTIEPAALPLVVRAGAGSARDTLSVLDQLLGGAGPDGRHLRRWPPACSATRPTPCSTRSSTRSPPATARRCSASSTR